MIVLEPCDGIFYRITRPFENKIIDHRFNKGIDMVFNVLMYLCCLGFHFLIIRMLYSIDGNRMICVCDRIECDNCMLIKIESIGSSFV